MAGLRMNSLRNYFDRMDKRQLLIFTAANAGFCICVSAFGMRWVHDAVMERRYAKASMKLLNKNTTAVEILGKPIVGKFSWYNIFGIGSSCTDDVATLNIAVIGPKASGNYRFEAAREDEVEWSLVKAVLTIPSSNENPENVINLLPNGEVLTSEILKTKTETGKEKEIRNK